MFINLLQSKKNLKYSQTNQILAKLQTANIKLISFDCRIYFENKVVRRIETNRSSE